MPQLSPFEREHKALLESAPALPESIESVIFSAERIAWDLGRDCIGANMRAYSYDMNDGEEELVVMGKYTPQELYFNDAEAIVPWNFLLSVIRNKKRIGSQQIWYATVTGEYTETADFAGTLTVVQHGININADYKKEMVELRRRLRANTITQGEEELLEMYYRDLNIARKAAQKLQDDSQGRLTDTDVSIMKGAIEQVLAPPYGREQGDEAA